MPWTRRDGFWMLDDASVSKRWWACGFIHAAGVDLYRRRLLINNLAWEGRLGKSICRSFCDRSIYFVCTVCMEA